MCIYWPLALVCCVYTINAYEGFCIMTPCRFVYGSNVSEELRLPSSGLYGPEDGAVLSHPKSWYLYTNLHGVVLCTVRIFISTAMLTANVKYPDIMLDYLWQSALKNFNEAGA